jgi:hypothetical protein
MMVDVAEKEEGAKKVGEGERAGERSGRRM